MDESVEDLHLGGGEFGEFKSVKNIEASEDYI
jgi:hypothetical protein